MTSTKPIKETMMPDLEAHPRPKFNQKMYERLREELADNPFTYDPYEYEDLVMVSVVEDMACRYTSIHRVVISREVMLFEIQHFKPRNGRPYIAWTRTMEERLSQLDQERVPYSTIQRTLCAEFMQGKTIGVEEMYCKRQELVLAGRTQEFWPTVAVENLKGLALQGNMDIDEITAAIGPRLAEPLTVEETEHKLQQLAHQARVALAAYEALLPTHGRE